MNVPFSSPEIDLNRPQIVENRSNWMRSLQVLTQFNLGPALTGAQPHFHGDAWNGLVYVLDAVCFVYTCRRLIDLSLPALYVYMPAIDRSLE